jgi:hypothetical protein
VTRRPKRRQQPHRPAGPVAPSRGPAWLRPVLSVLAGAYLATLFLTAGAPKLLPEPLLPRVPRYFTQVACLFPHAARRTIDYRMEVWRCDQHDFVELEVRGLFPIHADDKESRFHRVGHFYRRHRTVMRALEQYVVQRERARDPASPIGGIRVLSLRIPFPELGLPTPRWEARPLETYPTDQRKDWYYTPVSRRRIFCAGGNPDRSGPDLDDEGGSTSGGHA